MSGRASTGSLTNSMVPQMIHPNVNNPMMSLFLTEKRMIAFNMISDFFYERVPKKSAEFWRLKNRKMMTLWHHALANRIKIGEV
jgi:hypothetical protein